MFTIDDFSALFVELVSDHHPYLLFDKLLHLQCLIA